MEEGFLLAYGLRGDSPSRQEVMLDGVQRREPVAGAQEEEGVCAGGGAMLSSSSPRLLQQGPAS